MSRTLHYDDTLGFVPFDDANTSNALDALDCVEERKKGEWDMFDLISSAWYGKAMYFKQDNDMVYSRHSGKYMTVDEAIREFISLIDEENIAFVPSVTTAWPDGEPSILRPVVRGNWEEHGEPNECGEYEIWYYSCTRCGAVGIPQYNFCPNCGANMREES